MTDEKEKFDPEYKRLAMSALGRGAVHGVGKYLSQREVKALYLYVKELEQEYGEVSAENIRLKQLTDSFARSART